MKKTSIKAHLKKYSIYSKRATTINHAFASALAPTDTYNESMVDTILSELECIDNQGRILCVYCGINEAQTWDHLFALVKDNEPSGYGHRYGNLVPSCKDCNSKKGNWDWRTANNLINKNNSIQKDRVERVIKNHINKYPPKGSDVSHILKTKINKIKENILQLMRQADEIIKTEQENI